MNKQRIIRLSIPHQPLHRPENIRLGRNTHRILLIIRKNHHILAPIPELVVQEDRHVGDIVDAPAQLVRLAGVVDADEKGATTACACRVLEVVVRGRAVAEVLGALGGWWGEVWLAP